MKYDMKRPCEHCPFRTDVEPFLRAARAEEIADTLRAGAEFPCHKTIEHDDDGEGVETADTKHCAGALIIQEQAEQPSQMMRIAERLGMYDRRILDMDAPVYDDLEEFEDRYYDAENA